MWIRNRRIEQDMDTNGFNKDNCLKNRVIKVIPNKNYDVLKVSSSLSTNLSTE